jgi:hypothetical protein
LPFLSTRPLFPIFLIALLNSRLLLVLRTSRRTACCAANKIITSIAVRHTLLIIRSSGLLWLFGGCGGRSVFSDGFESFFRGGHVGGLGLCRGRGVGFVIVVRVVVVVGFVVIIILFFFLLLVFFFLVFVVVGVLVPGYFFVGGGC